MKVNIGELLTKRSLITPDREDSEKRFPDTV